MLTTALPQSDLALSISTGRPFAPVLGRLVGAPYHGPRGPHHLGTIVAAASLGDPYQHPGSRDRLLTRGSW